jgi:hypothetical protein
LALEDSDSEANDEAESPVAPTDTGEKAPNSVPQGNSLLAQLAKERAERHNEKAEVAAAASAPSGNKKKNKKKKPKDQKLGAGKKEKEPEEKFDDLDDMAFLDAQIGKAQNSHGRKVEGKGNYRTIVNGMLNARPDPHTKPTNTQANVALKSKLKEAQTSRRAKPKKKK